MSQWFGGAARRWGLGLFLHGRGGLGRGQRQLGIPSLAPGEASVEVTPGHLPLPRPWQHPPIPSNQKRRKLAKVSRVKKKKTNHLGVTHPGRQQGLPAPHLTQWARSCTPVCPSFFPVSPTLRAYKCQIQSYVVLWPRPKTMCYGFVQGSLRKHSPG